MANIVMDKILMQSIATVLFYIYYLINLLYFIKIWNLFDNQYFFIDFEYIFAHGA